MRRRPGDPAVNALRLAVGTLTVLRVQAPVVDREVAGRAMVLAIDDAHLLDHSSAALVYLLARSARTSVLGTLRSGHPVPYSIRALWTEDLVDHADLTEMDPTDGAALLSAMLGDQVDPVSADRLWRLAAGNALLLRELVIAAQSSRIAAVRLSV
mgnify:CR=1 FL=1